MSKSRVHSGPEIMPSAQPLLPFPDGDFKDADASIERAPSPQIRRERYPTNTTTRFHPIHRWFNFIAGFSPEFVAECIDLLLPERRRVLLDPFAGCGTAQVEGLRRGLDVIGYEAHPIFARISRAKVNSLREESDVNLIAMTISKGLSNPLSPLQFGAKPLEFLSKLFADDDLARLAGAKQALFDANLASNDLAFLVLSKIIDLTSQSQTDGIYKAPASKKKRVDPETALESVISMIREDLLLTERVANHAAIYEHSSEVMSEIAPATVDVIVTSPPYLNNFDFAEMTRMHLYFWGLATSWSEISDRVRALLIANTTTALKGHKAKQTQYRSSLPIDLQPELDKIVNSLAASRTSKAGKKEYDYLVYPYFAQLRSVLKECKRVLKIGGHFHMIVADAALYGTYIPTQDVITRLLIHEGFRDIVCTYVRQRGHRWLLKKREGSPHGLGEYHIRAIG